MLRTAAAGRVSGRPISLFWLPSFRSVGKRRAEDGRDRLLRRGLGDAPGDPDDERVEPAPPARPRPPGGRERVGDADDRRRRAARGRRPSGGRATRTAAAPAATASADECVAVRPLARQGDEQVARRTTSRESTAPPRTGRSDRASSRPPVGAASSSAVSPDQARRRRPGRRRGIGHGRQCRIGASSPVGGRRVDRRPSARQEVGRRDRVGRRSAGTARTTSPASRAGRPGRRSGVPSSIRTATTRSGIARLRGRCSRRTSS